MKEETRTYYENVVRAAVERIVGGLDEALDLSELARSAALSPLHFHRIFRGMVGETPLELHRRLRLERAAWLLAHGDSTVTSIAFGAGYETHESFTRSFRDVYSTSPSEFRERSRRARDSCSRPPPFELAARSGVHFAQERAAQLHLSITTGGQNMDVDIQTMPEMRVAATAHRGPYNTISEAFARLGAIAGPAGLLQQAGAEMVAIYHDDPETTPPAELRSDAGIVVPADASIPKALGELRIAAGNYARTTHIGPYTLLGDAWARFMGEWLPKSSHRVGPGMSFEIYRNNPTTTAQSELRTDLYLPID
jgi:AraC family transcriptional regulator